MAKCDVSSLESKSIVLAEVTEFGVSLKVNRDSLSPKRNEGYYCQEMDVNRALVTTALSVFCETGHSVFKPVRCIDVIGSTGVAGLLWKKYLASDVHVHINDPHENSHQIILDNRQRNGLETDIHRKDPCVLLHEMPFSFIYLDCHTDASFYLDSLMRNIPKQGIIAINTKDDGALYGRTPDMALRNYGGTITKTFYSKELAARLIVAGMVRSAAVHSKGLEVLCVLSVKSTITILVKILKGPAQANSCMAKIKPLVHCNMCEDRGFYPSSVYPVENPGSLLSCKCLENTPGKVLVNVGPVWSGSLFNANFVRTMISHMNKYPWEKSMKEVMETLLYEAWCPNLEGEKLLKKVNDKIKNNTLHQPLSENQEPPVKKKKEDTQNIKEIAASQPEPPFYFNLHKHCPKGPKMVKVGKVVSNLQKAGFRASRTHFDPLAVKTTASLSELMGILSHSMD
ncbi:TRMT1-like protein [Frankliniella occidentalis]|uniref:tRNA (guanine(26)-N(2))-dimethyltransferase n=1 Tax=Frankliniella occidentalis TaxID=133901 RepID=A0A6J1SFY6_FRAOC|nr:TRMT1-like protein [Frankliniella occidentalis]